MGVIKQIPEPYCSLRGVHLYHAAMSNCSQRVRIVLQEKQVSWVSHLINLGADEHLEPEYQMLHPKGVVPALVHDGVGIIESNDIIRYIDERFPEPSFLPETPDRQRQTDELLQLSDDVQKAIKLLSYLVLFGDRLKKTDEQLKCYAERQRNAALVEWQRRFSKDEFTQEEIDAAVENYRRALAQLDSRLADSAFLVDDKFGLADISWVVNIRRAELLELRQPNLLQLQSFPNLLEWYERLEARPSFHSALLAFEPGVFDGGSVLSTV